MLVKEIPDSNTHNFCGYFEKDDLGQDFIDHPDTIVWIKPKKRSKAIYYVFAPNKPEKQMVIGESE